MGEAFSEDKFKGRSILVGLEMNAKGEELLEWTLSTVAEQGDRVVAVHIFHYSDLKNTTFSLLKVLEDYLETCESLCNLKQIVLVGRVSRGKSIREALVKEAKVYDAEKVVVGAKNKQISLGGSVSLAKYCAKKLPPTTAVMAVQNGKVIFQKVATTNANSSLVVALKPSSDYNLVRKLVEPRLGWPLLKKEATKYAEDEARKMSVVRWVMNLPNRSLSVDQQHLNLIQELNDILIRNGSNCRWFQYDELHSSTSQFCSENLIGKGGSSQVYRGYLSDGRQVAIKLSKLSEETSRHFLLEVDIITKLEHKLIVPLLGICIEDATLVSVYKYFQKGSLEENLHGKNGKCSLNWNLRFRVAIGIAEALSYLHNDCSNPVIHRDVKSSNILLTDEFEPQLSDFGLAMWAPTSLTDLTQNDVVGTFGYLAPEYFMHGKISNKVDVFAFGVVLLELLTGRKPIDEEISKGHGSLVMWATPLLEKQEFAALLDPNLNDNYVEAEMKRMMMAASLCITRRVRLRPRMREILNLLQGEESMESWMNCHSDATSKSNRMSDSQDDEAYPCSTSSIGSHLSLALLDVEDDTSSFTSFEQSNLGSLDYYIRERWGRSSSFE